MEHAVPVNSIRLVIYYFFVAQRSMASIIEPPFLYYEILRGPLKMTSYDRSNDQGGINRPSLIDPYLALLYQHQN